MTSDVDVLLVSVGATTGWRAAARELAGAFERAGARTATADSGPVRQVRTFMATDLHQAAAARRAAARGIAQARPAAIVYCSITAALLWPAPGAIWLDSLAAENRPGRHGVWQRMVERRRVAAAPLLLTMAPGALEALGGRPHAEAVVVPVAVEPSAPAGAPVDPPAPAGAPAGAPAAAAAARGAVRDVDVLVYGADPVKRRLDLVLSAWGRARRGDEALVVAGLARERWRGAVPPGVSFAGRLPADEYRALLRRTRVFVAAPRREDFGIGALEALADGALLVTTPAAGPYPALGIARALDPRLVSEDLAPALRAALDTPAPDYAARAAALLAPFSRAVVTRTISEDVLPRLLPGFTP